MTIATIDMGSNSYHLLVSDWREGQLQQRFAAVERVRTALLMDGDCLTTEARDRALDCLGRFAASARAHNCEAIYAAATSAVRRASNGALLLEPAARLLGTPVRVLSGSEEAGLIHLAVAATGQIGAEAGLVIDIGGGSTELSLGGSCGPDAVESLALGCVSSLQAHFSDGVIDSRCFDACVDQARAVIEPVAATFSSDAGRRVFACSGTAQAIAQLTGANCLTRDLLNRLRDQLLAQRVPVEQLRIPGLDENRSLLLSPGLAIMFALFDVLSLSSVRIVDVALREGLALACFKAKESDVAEFSLDLVL